MRLVGVCLLIGVWEDWCGGEWGLEGGVGLPRVRFVCVFMGIEVWVY